MHIHILVISGAMTAPLAIELKRQGHKVTGSDQEKTYPPFNLLLKKHHIPINKTPISKKIDLVIVGSAYKNIPKTSQEFEIVKKNNINYISATNFISKNIIKNNSVVIAGSYGKTTCTSLVISILKKAKYNPSHFFGGMSNNKNFPSIKINSSSWSVVEGDESINGLDTQAKFLYYKPKHVILTSADWEHKDSYKTEKDNFNAFKRLIQKIPQNGLLVYNPNNKNAIKASKFCQAKAIPYDFSLKFSTPLIGKHNHENIIAAYTLCRNLGIKDTIIKQAIKSFKGVARRLQILKETNKILFIDDFAQSAERIKQAINAVKESYPKRPIKIFFEPHASFLKTKRGLINFDKAFCLVNEVILGPISFTQKIDKNNRVTANDFKNIIGKKLTYIPVYDEIFTYFKNTLKPNDILLHMSSGGLDGLNTLKKIIKSLKIKN